MAWHREGETIQAQYFDQPVQGRVVESRVRYGGRVSHTIDLLQAITLPWRLEPVTRCIVDEVDIKEEFKQ